MIILHRIPAGYETIRFPDGAEQIRVGDIDATSNHITIEYRWAAGEDMAKEVVRLLMVADAIKQRGHIIYNLILDYLPYGRQDRVAVGGDCFALKVFADMINTIEAEIVTLNDPHSDVAKELINNCQVITQYHLLGGVIEKHFVDTPYHHPLMLISPDQGASEKSREMARHIKSWTRTEVDVLYCTKVRDPVTGRLGLPQLPGASARKAIDGKACIIVDDICDGGGTFIALAQALKGCGAKSVHLIVSHGIYSKGLDVFKGYINSIYTRELRVL